MPGSYTYCLMNFIGRRADSFRVAQVKEERRQWQKMNGEFSTLSITCHISISGMKRLEAECQG